MRVGFIGLGELAGLRIDEWMRQFIAQTRDYGDIDLLAQELCDLIQEDFNYDHPSGTDIRHAGLIVHLGGFDPPSGSGQAHSYKDQGTFSHELVEWSPRVG